MDTNSRKDPYLILGLDPGIASCGFCLIDTVNHEILEMGSRLHDIPQNPKNEVSLAKERRGSRSTRRNNRRTKVRLNKCLDYLKEAGLVPKDADKAWLRSRKGDKQLLRLRCKGLDYLLTDREFAQVLYALCSRRGYIPHGEGLTGEANDAEGKKVLKAIAENNERLKTGTWRTVGEMLAAQGTSRNHRGSYEHCVYNSQIQDEVREIFKAQRRLGNLAASKTLEEKYFELLTYETKSLDHDAKNYGTVGRCSYFVDETRAAQADLSSELCRAYERFGNLVMVGVDGKEHRLTHEQRNHYLDILFSCEPIAGNKECKVSYTHIRKDLDLPSSISFKGISTNDEKKEVFVPKAWRLLRNHDLSAKLLVKMRTDRAYGDAICEALTYASTEESLLDQLEIAGISPGDAERIKNNIPFTSKVFKGYGSRSLKALNLLVEAFEEDGVLTLTDAEDASGLLALRLSNNNQQRTELLPAYAAYDPTCKNPVVLRSLAQMRKIVNAIIRLHGVPNEIHIELGRELKQSKREKDLISTRNKENEKNNAHLRELAAGIKGCSPEEVPKKVIRKLSLREEQKQKDVYTGQTIDLEQLVLDDHYCEIDHILPYSRTCDDSRANKVLVLHSSNQNKRERTPYEWMTSGEEGVPSWDEFKKRVQTIVESARKRDKLLNTDLSPEKEKKFIDRNLNDTRYMARAVKDYLENCLIFPEDGKKQHVIAVQGGATASLRWVWGLNMGERNTKDRSDARHHAVDAAVIAACSVSTIQKVAQARSLGRETFKHLRKSRLADTQPWESFARDVLAYRDQIVPTYMVSHGVTGQAFEENLHHLEGYDERGYFLVKVKTKDKKSSKIEPKGNARILPDNSVQLVGGMAFLRLWLDKDARPTGKVKGKWYAEPVYYADIPAIRNETYIPRAIERGKPRNQWTPIPRHILNSDPIVLFMNDVLMVDDHIARYKKIGIANAQFVLTNLLTFDRVSDFPSLGSWGKDTHIKVIQQDCLGHSLSKFVLNPDDSTYTLRAEPDC